jgi:hypothetical protein
MPPVRPGTVRCKAAEEGRENSTTGERSRRMRKRRDSWVVLIQDGRKVDEDFIVRNPPTYR